MIRGRKADKNQSSSSILNLSNILSTLGNAGPGSGFLLEISGVAFGTQEVLGNAFWLDQIPISEYRDPESRPRPAAHPRVPASPRSPRTTQAQGEGLVVSIFVSPALSPGPDTQRPSIIIVLGGFAYWGIVALQRANFCCTTKQINHMYTCNPSLDGVSHPGPRGASSGVPHTIRQALTSCLFRA